MEAIDAEMPKPLLTGNELWEMAVKQVANSSWGRAASTNEQAPKAQLGGSSSSNVGNNNDNNNTSR